MSDIRFNQWLHNSGTGGISQDSAGHVGIGTTVPTHINALTNNNSILHVGIVSCNTLNAASKIEGSIDDWIIHQDDTNTKFGFPGADQFEIHAGGGPQVHVNSSGFVGINTSTMSNAERLAVQLGNDEMFELRSAAQELFQVWKEGSTEECRLNVKHGGSTKIHIRGNGTSYFDGGRFGVGTSAPSFFTEIDASGVLGDVLKIKGSSTGQMVNIQNAGGSSIPSIVRFANHAGNAFWDVTYDNSNNNFTLDYLDSVKLTLDSSGHMGLGITPSDIDSIGRALNIASSTGGAIYLQDTDAPTTKFAAISYNGATAKLQIHAHHSASFIDLGTNGTQRINITSTGEVLIGSRTAKPNDINKLVVTGTSPADAYDSQCYLEGSETSGAVNTGGALAFGGHDGSSYRNWANIYGMKENSTGGNTAAYISFHTRAAGGNPAEKMRISSAGYVTTPQNPKFWYSSLSNSSSSGATSSTDILKFATERHNQGSNYNASNGRFTAPVAGTYWFSFIGLVDNSGSSSHYWAQLWRNGSTVTSIGYTYSDNGQYSYFGGSACIYLAKDDYAQIYASANIHTGNESSFSGFLIG